MRSASFRNKEDGADIRFWLFKEARTQHAAVSMPFHLWRAGFKKDGRALSQELLRAINPRLGHAGGCNPIPLQSTIAGMQS